ncbi:MAG: hypothetical protein LBC84_00700 [Prevotellaceae bacterium]|nr:hypothetical protein [Prevotellaceae bacterium]
MDFTPIIVVPTIMYFAYKVFEALIRRKERVMLIEKLDTSNLQALPSRQEALNVLDYMPNKRHSGLRTGLLLAGVGFGLIVAWTLFIVLYQFNVELYEKSYRFRDTLHVIYLASPAFFGGIGLLLSYFIEQKARKQSK